jgi:hypothetical protein
VARPISALFMGAALLAYLTPAFRWFAKRWRAAGHEATVGPIPS